MCDTGKEVRKMELPDGRASGAVPPIKCQDLVWMPSAATMRSAVRRAPEERMTPPWRRVVSSK